MQPVPDWSYYVARQQALGLPTTSFPPPGYFESLRDGQINRFLFTVGTLYSFYFYPITLYVTAGVIGVSYILIYIYKYRKIKQRIKGDFVYNPKSRYSEAFERDVHERMQARENAVNQKKPTKK